MIIGGDFNCALPPKDRKSVKQATNKHMVIKQIGNLCSHFDFTDIWQQLNPQTLSFTWHDKAFKTQRQLDFFSITPNLVNIPQNSVISCILHSQIILLLC